MGNLHRMMVRAAAGRPVGGGPAITESFDGPDSGSLGPDLSWTDLAGNWTVVSNKAKSNTGGRSVAVTDTGLTAGSMYAQADLAMASSNNGVGPLICSLSSVQTYYYAEINLWSQFLKIFRTDSGSNTSLAEIAFTVTVGTTYEVRVEHDGAGGIKMFVDGVEELTATDGGTVLTGTYAGLRTYSSDASEYAEADNFEAGA